MEMATLTGAVISLSESVFKEVSDGFGEKEISDKTRATQNCSYAVLNSRPEHNQHPGLRSGQHKIQGKSSEPIATAPDFLACGIITFQGRFTLPLALSSK
jgi:hypothetical protein